MLANFSNLITFSRGSNATMTDASGRLTYAANNLLTNSQDFEAAAWTKDGSSVTANAAIAPDGTTTADRVTEDASSGVHRVYQSLTTANITNTFSIYLKYVSRRWVYLRTKDSSNTNRFAWFDLQNGVVGTVQTNLTASITPAGSGWYRCTITVASAFAGANFTMVGLASADNNETYAGDGTSNILIWGAQLEAVTYQTTPSPYVSTSVANLLGFSEAFDNAAWTKSNASIVPNAAQNPINNLWNAQKLMENTVNAAHALAVNVSGLTTGQTYTTSVYAKAGERAKFDILAGAGTGSGAAVFDLVAVTATGGGTITSVGNGWYRCSVQLAPNSGLLQYLLRIYSGAAATYTGDGNSGIYIYGAQLSNSGSLDPYVPTPGAAPSSTAYYGPRFDYDPVTLAAKGILIEEQRTNLLTYSEQFDNAAWVKSGVTISANSVISPDGTADADKLVENATTGAHQTYNGPISITAGTAYTYSIYAKQAERSWLAISANDGGEKFTWFNLATGTIGTNDVGNSPSIVSVGNGWYRCSVRRTVAAGTTYGQFFVCAADNAYSYTGNGTSGIYIYGAQLEAGAFATSYIPTVASQVTRTADVASITGSLFSQWFNGNEGTLVADVQKLSTSASAPYAWELIGATSNFSMRVRLGTDSRMQSVDGGAVQADAQLATPVLTTPAKYAMAYRLNDYAGSTGGAAVATDTSGTVPAVTTLSIGSAAVANVYVRNITYYPTRLTNDQLQAITK